MIKALESELLEGFCLQSETLHTDVESLAYMEER